MHIRALSLRTRNIDAQRKFYGETLGLTIKHDYDEYGFEVQIGTTELRFWPSRDTSHSKDEPSSDLYHFAFNIPENQIEQARDWLLSRAVPLITDGETTIFDFKNWNAHSIYFRDGAGNIVEFIARHRLPNASERPFDTSSILCVSEMGIATDDVRDTVQKITETYNVPVFDGAGSDTFTAMGDDNGLLIVVKTGRVWYPNTGVLADGSPYGVTIEENPLLKDQAQVKEILFARNDVPEELEKEFNERWVGIEHLFETHMIFDIDREKWIERQKSKNSASRFYTDQELAEVAEKHPDRRHLLEMIRIIQALRISGYENSLRPGQSLLTFMLSRSAKHGLRGEQAFVHIDTYGERLTAAYHVQFGLSGSISIQIEQADVDITPELEALLLRLMMHPID
jgi:catechol 2,3-dioxygenase-like lactoylglutathione lyase family enzyme